MNVPVVEWNDPILNMLSAIRRRPANYIGAHSAELLYIFVAGYEAALRDQKIDYSLYRDFIDGLYRKYGRGGRSWAMLLEQVAGSDAAGLDLFFTEMDAYWEVDMKSKTQSN